MTFLLRLETGEQAMGFGEGVFFQLVVNPASLLPVRHYSGVLEHLQVKGQSRLRGIERAREITNAAFALSEKVDQLDARLVG